MVPPISKYKIDVPSIHEHYHDNIHKHPSSTHAYIHTKEVPHKSSTHTTKSQATHTKWFYLNHTHHTQKGSGSPT
jgi:hypothetical protein